VVAYEPNTSDARRISWQACLNRLGHLSVEPLALADRAGEAQFHVPVSGVRTTASLRRPNDSRSRFKAIRVRLESLDHVAADSRIEQIDLIKVDVEGAEMKFLDGAAETIRRLRPLLIIEAIDDVCKEWGHSGSQLLLRVQNDFEYRLFSFTDEGYLSPHEVGDIYPLISRCNFLACPVDDLARIGSFLQIKNQGDGIKTTNTLHGCDE
jgi:FkbM family methyltransferase